MAKRAAGGFLAILLCLFMLSSNCIIHDSVRVTPLSPGEAVEIKSPVKAHLLDGFTAVYADGLAIRDGRIIGTGILYDLALKPAGAVEDLPVDRVVALESFQEKVNVGLSILASAGAAYATAALLKVTFGSCPTVYADIEGRETLESELFSYAIAPLFETRDVDRLAAQPDSDGILQLDVRNEALETHYLNHLELIEVRHSSDEVVVPNQRGTVVALKDFSSPLEVRDRSGRDLRAVLARNDDSVFHTAPERLRSVTAGDLTDSVEMLFRQPRGGREVALLFRLRNSLLNTVLLYDEMLGAAGARSVDWLGDEMGRPLEALRLASWYSSRMGMRVEMWEEGAWREVARLPDTGPIAWEDVAVVFPSTSEEVLRVRLTFPADNWRIDRLRLAGTVRWPAARSVPAAAVIASDGPRDDAALRSLASPDSLYLQTSPGQSFIARFDVGRHEGPGERTFLMSGKGYYTEWIRASWIKEATRAETFSPTDDALLAAMVRWRDVQTDFEARFDAARIPVRR